MNEIYLYISKNELHTIFSVVWFSLYRNCILTEYNQHYFLNKEDIKNATVRLLFLLYFDIENLNFVNSNKVSNTKLE